MGYAGQSGSSYGGSKHGRSFGLKSKKKRIKQALQKDVEEEVKDAGKYFGQADDLDSVGDHEGASVIRGVGEQELTHAEMEKAVLKKS